MNSNHPLVLGVSSSILDRSFCGLNESESIVYAQGVYIIVSLRV